MNNIELIKQIIDIVSEEIPEIKELKELCIVKYYPNDGKNQERIGIIYGDIIDYEDGDVVKSYNRGNIKKEDIIGQIGYHDLLMYLSWQDLGGSIFIINEFGDLQTRNFGDGYLETDILTFDLSKPLMEQSQEVLQQLLDYLKSLK